MKRFLLLALIGFITSQACCPGCECGIDIDDHAKAVAKLGAAEITSQEPGLKFERVLQVKKQVVAGLMYTFIEDFTNIDGDHVYYEARVWDHFGQIKVQSHTMKTEKQVKAEMGDINDVKSTKGCCYEVGFGSRMVASYNSFRVVNKKDCPVEPRIGGETRFEKDSCDNVKIRLGVSQNGAQAPTKGCCYEVGYGAMNKKIYANFKLSAEKDCKVEPRLGGATVFDKRDCDTLKVSLGQGPKPRTSNGKENAVMTGGWKEVDPSSVDANTAGQFGADHIKARINTILSDCHVKTCMAQVVAGMNYKLVLQCKAMGVETKNFAVQVFRGLDGKMQVKEFHELGQMTKTIKASVPFKACPGKSGSVTIKTVNATSWPPKKGSSESITASGTGTKAVSGGKWLLTATWKGYKILTDGGNVCDTTKCPAPAGPFTATVTVSIPTVEPSGKYEVNTSATDQDGALLFCVVAAFNQ